MSFQYWSQVLFIQSKRQKYSPDQRQSEQNIVEDSQRAIKWFCVSPR